MDYCCSFLFILSCWLCFSIHLVSQKEMGGTLTTASTDVVPPELLVSKLIGHTNDDDYYARSTLLLNEFKVNDPTNGEFSDEFSFNIEDAYKMLDEPSLEHGYVRRKDGSWYIACYTELGRDINGEMIDWWFRNCDNNEKYRWWHPKNHVAGTWEPQFYAVMPHERKAGHCIDHTHIVEEIIDGKARSMQIEYTRPSKYFDVSRFEEYGVTACLVGRIYIKDSSLGMVAAGHVLHMVREHDGVSEMRSRYWLGDIAYPETVENFVFARLVNYVSSFPLYRLIKMPTAYARGIWIHCAEEMACLREFLPHYYATVLLAREHAAAGGSGSSRKLAPKSLLR